MLDAPRKRNVQNVKILATSDLHGKLKHFKKAVLREKPEIVIIAGDITDRSGDDRARAARTWKALGDFCASDDAKGIDFVVVPGNHDEGSHRIAKELFRQTDNIHYLDRHAPAPTEIRGIRFFGGEKNKPEKLRKIHGKADVVVFHYNPTEGDARMAVVRQLDPELVIYGHHHRSNHREHFEKKPDRFLKMNVSTWVESGYGYYLVDYTRGGAITADWKDGR